LYEDNLAIYAPVHKLDEKDQEAAVEYIEDCPEPQTTLAQKILELTHQIPMNHRVL
jgi:hypothetical protein